MSITPFEALHWHLNPGSTALVVIDPQNDFLHASGWYAEKSIDITHMQRSIEPTRRLVEACHAADVPVIWTRHGSHDARDAGTFHELRPFLRDGGLRIGTWGYEILDGLDYQERDWIIEKQRLSAFFQTNLEIVLRGLHADTVLICGVLTNQCVAATSKDATFRDFRPIVVEEATGTTFPHLHEPAIEMMKVGWAQVSQLDDVLAELAAFPVAAR